MFLYASSPSWMQIIILKFSKRGTIANLEFVEIQ